jgi:hypothetical protein
MEGRLKHRSSRIHMFERLLMVLMSVAAAGGGGGGGGGGGEVHTQIGPYTIHNRDKQGSRESTIHEESHGLKLMFSSHSQNDDERRPCVARLFLTSGKGVFFFSVSACQALPTG